MRSTICGTDPQSLTENTRTGTLVYLCPAFIPLFRNHAVLEHWDSYTRGQYPNSSVRFDPFADILHSPFYPELGPYSVKNSAVLDRHFLWMKSAGIGVVVLSWWGRPEVEGTSDSQGVNTNSAVPAIVAAAERHGMKFAFHLEPYPVSVLSLLTLSFTCALKGRSAQTISIDVNYLVCCCLALACRSFC